MARGGQTTRVNTRASFGRTPAGDMLVGWAVAYAAMWEVIKTDPTFSDATKAVTSRRVGYLQSRLVREWV